MGLFGGKKELIGLDIGSSSIKVAHIKGAGIENKLKNFGVYPLPSDAIVDGAIMDQAAIVEGIKSAIRSMKIREKNVAISLSGHSVIIKKIQLATTTTEELEESIQWEVEQYIPFDIKDVMIDFHVIGPLKEDPSKMDILLVAAKTGLINDYVTVVKEAGLVPRVVDIDSLAVGNAFESTQHVSGDQVPMVVNIGASFMNINVLHGGVPLFTRDVPMGGGMYTSEIQKQMAVSYEMAEDYKLGKKDPGDRSAKLEEIMKIVSNLIATEAQRSYNFFSATYPDRSVTKVYLTGGAAKSAYLKAILEEKIGVGVEIFNVMHGMSVDNKTVDSSILSKFNTSATVSVGLALRNLEVS
ncbi:MAG: pilus assembly protein PilM [Syntrophorhabdaceae bacterium]|nr:pilus assembly protein PilM [Syntrophorhabdaceae bacterium]